jgi:hypothetical protein
MAVTTWAARQNRNGVDQLTPALAVPAGSSVVYAELLLQAGDFTDPAERIQFAIYWSSDPAIPPATDSFQHIAGGEFVGGPPGSKTGKFSVEVPLPPGCTYVQAWYSIVNGPIRFGVSGEIR